MLDNLKTMNEKLNFCKDSIEYLKQWVIENEQLAIEITKALKNNVQSLDTNSLKSLTKYHIELSKTIYSSLALIDRISSTAITLNIMGTKNEEENQ